MEVHVLHDQVDRLAREQREAVVAAWSRERVSMSCSENSISSAVATAGLSSMTRIVGMAQAYRRRGRAASGAAPRPVGGREPLSRQVRPSGWRPPAAPPRLARRAEHRDLAEQPEHDRADRQVHQGQARQLVLAHQQLVDAVGEHHAEDDAERGQQEVLGLEVAQDLALASRRAHAACRSGACAAAPRSSPGRRCRAR